MADSAGASLTKAQLKDEVSEIILSQGNDFIKELLRGNGLKIGTTKKDFAENIAAAIESGELTQQMIEAWLYEIEGWGNQHLYLFEAPTIDIAGVSALLQDSEHAELVGVNRAGFAGGSNS